MPARAELLAAFSALDAINRGDNFTPQAPPGFVAVKLPAHLTLPPKLSSSCDCDFCRDCGPIVVRIADDDWEQARGDPWGWVVFVLSAVLLVECLLVGIWSE